MNRLRLRKLGGSLRLLAGVTAVPMLAFAQQSTSTELNPSAQDPVTLDKYEVTGSYIPVAAGAIASPVAVLSPEIVTRTGVTTNVLEVLRKAVPQFTGSGNIGSNNANIASGDTGGGSQAALRDLTTLTLINGRRAAVSPISGTGGFQFVDLNIIPLVAVDKVEVLLDGASATYGSDATSGVINIKTKSNYQGAMLGGFYEWSDQPGHWANRGGNFVIGASNGKTSVTIAGGWSRQDPLWQFERKFSSPQYGTPTFGGVINLGSHYFVLNPALEAPPVGATKPTIAFPMASSPVAPTGVPYFGAVGSDAVYWGKSENGGIVGFGAGELAGAASPEAEQVAFDLSRYVTILQRREQRGAMITFEHKIIPQINVFGDFLTATTYTFSQINAQPVGTTPDFNVTGDHPDNPFASTVRVRNRFVDNPRRYFYDTEFVRGVIGVRGDINERFSYEAAANLGRSDLAYRNPGVLDAARALAATGINPASTTPGQHPINMFQRNVPNSAVEDGNFVGIGYNDFVSELRSFDARILWKPFSLPGGELALAVGGEFRVEQLSGTADLNSIPDPETGEIGWTGATSVNPFSAKRDITAGFAEVMVPITGPQQAIPFAHTLELTAAVRYEAYSDTSDPTVPKITLRWLPINDEFAIRATYGESFNAPTLYNLFGPSLIGFTEEVSLLPFGADDTPDNYVAGQAQTRVGSNPGLIPAESKAWTAGFVWSPKALKGFSLKASYYHIEETNVVDTVPDREILQSLEDLGPASPYLAANAGPNNPVGNFINPATGQSLYDAAIEGFRANGTQITAPGQVAANLDSVYIENPLVNIASQETSGIDLELGYKWELANIGMFDVTSSWAYVEDYIFDGELVGGRATLQSGTIPRYQGYTQIAWTRGNLQAYVANRFVPSVHAPDEASGKTKAERYAEFDLGIRYIFGDGFLGRLKGLEVALQVNNVGNEAPPQLPDTFANDSVDTGHYDPIGRRYVVSASYRF